MKSECSSCKLDRRIQGRGLCSTCYHLHKKDGTLDDYQAKRRPTSVVMEEYEFLSSMGVSDERIAVQLGIQYDSLRNVLAKHQKKMGAA